MAADVRGQHSQLYVRVPRPRCRIWGRGSSIVNTASINGLRGNKSLIDYAATKGAVLALTYSLAQTPMQRGIRSAVAPGPVWTPLVPATMDAEKGRLGRPAPMERAAQPDEIAPSYVFFASGRLPSYFSGPGTLGGETLPLRTQEASGPAAASSDLRSGEAMGCGGSSSDPVRPGCARRCVDGNTGNAGNETAQTV